VVLLTLLCAPAPLFAQEQGPQRFTGHWEGAIRVPGTPLTIKVDLSNQEGVWRGRIDIPMQAAFGLPLGGISAAGDTIRFAIQGIPGNPSFEGILTEGSIEGDFTQSGNTFRFNLGREEVPPPPRPQTPEPPYPYREEEVTYQNGDVTLAATLTLPESDGPFPAVVLITGSGAQDRDETIFYHKPFRVIADHRTRAGIAVLRADDRGVGGSTGSIGISTTSDFADDALAGVGMLKQHPEINAGQIGLLGHSEGGVVVPMAAARSDDVAFIILLAGTAVPGRDILLRQLAEISRANLRVDEWVEHQRVIQEAALDAVIADADPDTIRVRIERLVRIQSPFATEDDIQRGAESEMARLQTPWYRYFLTYDPRTALREVTVPILALNGTLDLQVLHDQNLPEIEKALQEAGNQDVTIRLFEGLNHLFQSARTGSPAEYANIEETIAPEVLEAIREWIVARFNPSSP
jgi:pimeloyl-ACP methyl ester carboxylesterase